MSPTIYPYEKWEIKDIALNPKYDDAEDNTFDEDQIEGKDVKLTHWFNFSEIRIGEFNGKFLYINPEMDIYTAHGRLTQEFDYDFSIFSAEEPDSKDIVTQEELDKEWGEEVGIKSYWKLNECLCEHEENMIEKVVAFMAEKYPDYYEKYTKFVKGISKN